MLTSPYIITIKGLAPANIVYGFVSKAMPDCSFNYTKDPKAAYNRQLVIDTLGLKNTQLSMLNQVHGKTCLMLDLPYELDGEIEADGHVTTNKNILLGIKTADCVPVLFYDEAQEVIGSCHSGWRGAIGGILDETITKMIAKGARLQNITAIIGPCIQQISYEVSGEFYQQFLAENSSNLDFFINSVKPDRYMFDLPGYVTRKLQHLGITQIHNSGLDTLSNADKFFSYRRCTLKNQKLDGSILSVIGFRNVA